MESVARQFAKDNKCLLFGMAGSVTDGAKFWKWGKLPSKVSVLKAKPIEQANQPSLLHHLSNQ